MTEQQLRELGEKDAIAGRMNSEYRNCPAYKTAFDAKFKPEYIRRRPLSVNGVSIE